MVINFDGLSFFLGCITTLGLVILVSDIVFDKTSNHEIDD